MASVRSFVPALPLAPALQEVRHHIADTGLGETVERYGLAPALQGPARLGIERPKEEGGASEIDHTAAVHLPVGDPFSVGPPGRAQKPDRLRLAKDPERLARFRVDRHHLPARSDHRVEYSVDVDRCGPGKVIDVGAEVIAPPNPLLVEVLEVGGVDLGQGRGAGVPGIAAQITPLAVLGPWQALSEGGRCRHHQECERKAEAKHESLRWEGSKLNLSSSSSFLIPRLDGIGHECLKPRERACHDTTWRAFAHKVVG